MPDSGLRLPNNTGMASWPPATCLQIPATSSLSPAAMLSNLSLDTIYPNLIVGDSSKEGFGQHMASAISYPDLNRDMLDRSFYRLLATPQLPAAGSTAVPSNRSGMIPGLPRSSSSCGDFGMLHDPIHPPQEISTAALRASMAHHSYSPSCRLITLHLSADGVGQGPAIRSHPHYSSSDQGYFPAPYNSCTKASTT